MKTDSVELLLWPVIGTLSMRNMDFFISSQEKSPNNSKDCTLGEQTWFSCSGWVISLAESRCSLKGLSYQRLWQTRRHVPLVGEWPLLSLLAVTMDTACKVCWHPPAYSLNNLGDK